MLQRGPVVGMNLPGNDSFIWKDKNLYEIVERVEFIALCSYTNKEQVIFFNQEYNHILPARTPCI